MSVYCDKILGYMIDITEEFNSLSSDLQDKWISYNEEIEEQYKKLNFIPYYSDITPSSGEMIIINDGMSGNYTKLVLIIDYIYKSESEEHDEDLVNSINRELAKLKINKAIKEKFEEAYNIIFGLNKNKCDSIKVKYLIHWH